MKLYRIRHKLTGQFSKGGYDPIQNPKGEGRGWSKRGKVWTGLGPLKNHLNIARSDWRYLRETGPAYLSAIEVLEYSAADADGRAIEL